MITKVLNLVIKTDKAQEGLKETNQEIVSIEGNLDGVSAIGDKFTGGLVSGFTGALKSIKAVTMGFKSMKLAIISTGIGALVVALGSLAAAFTTSEEGQNKFNKLSTVMGAIVGNLVDLLADLGEKLIAAFENPQQALKDFTKLIKDNLVNRFEGLLELIPQLGKAVKLLFEGEFAEAGKVAINANAKIVLGVENITEKVEEAIVATQDFIKEQETEAKLAAKVADMRAKADKIERELLVNRSKLESDIALLRLKARQEDEFSAEVRKAALLEAQELEDQLLNQEKAALVLRRDAQLQENEFSRSNKENLDKAAQATAEVNRLVARRADIARTLQRELNTINNQIEAEDKRLTDEERKRLEEIEALKQKQLQEEIKREEQQFNLLQELTNTEQEQEIFKLMQQYDKKFELAVGNAELEKALAEQQANDISAINKKFDDKRVADNKVANDKIKANEKALQDAKFQLASSALNSISALANLVAQDNEQKAKAAFNINKAVGIAQVGINTSQAIMKAAAETTDFTPIQALRTGNMIAMGVAGALQIAAIAKQKFQPQGGGTSTASSSVSTGGVAGGTSAPSQPPSFNVVGQSGFNQIAGALSQQGPVQAFVVASEVTTQQQLDNAIVSTATLGN